MISSLLVMGISAAMVTAASSSACHDYVLISARGTYEVQGPSIGFVGMINTTLATIPNGIEYDVVYPASSNLTGAADGVADIARYINAGLAACPDQSYALFGYSQGASVVDIALQHNFTDQSAAAYNNIKAVVVVGNPGHVYGATANVDENGGDSTRNFTGSYWLGGTGAIPDAYYANDKVLDICYQGDVVCALPPNGTFAIEPAHLLYGSTAKIQNMGADFLIRKLSSSSTSAVSGASSTVRACSKTAAVSRTATPTGATQTTATAAATYTGAAAAQSSANFLAVLVVVTALVAGLL